jgi:hypothetical protein
VCGSSNHISLSQKWKYEMCLNTTHFQ